MAKRKSPKNRARAASKARARQRIWLVDVFQAPEYVLDDDGAYRYWASIWIDMKRERLVHLASGRTREAVLSREVFEKAAAAAGTNAPTAIQVLDSEVRELLSPNLPEGMVAGAELEEAQYEMIDTLRRAVLFKLEDTAPGVFPVALAPLTAPQARAALIEAAGRFAEVSLGIERAFARITGVGRDEPVFLAILESGVLALPTLEYLDDDLEGDWLVPDLVSVAITPRRTLDPKLRADVDEAETGPLTEYVPTTLCTDADVVQRPATDDDLALLTRCLTAVNAWLQDRETTEVDGMTLEVINPRTYALGLEGGGDAFQMKVVLDGTDPEVWRRIVVPKSATLEALHLVIQRAMGWKNEHLHQFEIKKQLYSPDPSWENEEDECLVRLGDLLRARQKFTYLYDFGDSWHHTITVEKTIRDHDGPECIDGARACPPEDCGGAWGYANMLQTLASPRASDREELLDWVGEGFDPAAVDLSAARRAVRALTSRR